MLLYLSLSGQSNATIHIVQICHSRKTQQEKKEVNIIYCVQSWDLRNQGK